MLAGKKLSALSLPTNLKPFLIIFMNPECMTRRNIAESAEIANLFKNRLRIPSFHFPRLGILNEAFLLASDQILLELIYSGQTPI